MSDQDAHSEQFATARDIAQRWNCHVDTVFSRLQRAGVPTYRFTARLIRWRWADVYTFEDALAVGEVPDDVEALLNYVPRKRGPRRATGANDD